ncbi:HpnL family protein [Formicincola oecophyllae]|uniref:HpnL family protein n=2 Tax=Formicincola oecophyllae TaxID=2558361 RepID=A0A4Y6UD92_9PROT|nr:HpnL family protein [Formicincola oecophyllae]
MLKKNLPFLFAMAGIALLVFLTVRAGWEPVLHALLQVGIGGFALLILGQLGINLGLGWAWKAEVPFIPYKRLVWARLVRDAACTCLPFSQLGGLILGIRATAAGEPALEGGQGHLTWPLAVAANLVDLTAEVAAQIVFVMAALLCLLGHSKVGGLVWPLLGGLALLTLGLMGFVWTQRHSGAFVPRVVGAITRFLPDDWKTVLQGNMAAFQNALERLWAQPLHILHGAFRHFLCWLASAAVGWLALRLLGAAVPFTTAVAIEGIVCGAMAAGFMVPAALGVQEGAYVAIGAVYGLPSDMMMGLSLLRRGRDLAIGLPVLLVWQGWEVQLRRRKGAPPTQAQPPANHPGQG